MGGGRPGGAKAVKNARLKAHKSAAKTKKGNPTAGTKNRVRSENGGNAEDKALSKAIASASESKVAAKLLQAGKTLNTVKDSLQKGKEINREKRRDQVKKKVGRTEQNYLAAKAKDEIRDQ